MPAADTLCTLFRRSVEEGGEGLALSGGGEEISWREYGERVDRLAAGWESSGLKPGDVVALLMDTAPTFHIVDTSVMHARATPFSLAAGDPTERHALLLRLSRAAAVVAEPGYADRARAAIARAGTRAQLILTEDGHDGGLLAGDREETLAAVAARGAGAISRAWADADPEEIATLIFTSGTTGQPKGVRVSHRSIVASLENTDRIAPVTRGGHLVACLPMSHIAERFMSHYHGLAFACAVTDVADPEAFFDEVVRVRPTRFFSVPRIYEKLAAQVRRLVGDSPGLAEALGRRLDVVRDEQRGCHLDPVAREQDRQRLDELAVIRAALGLDRTEYRGVATAPSAPEVLELLSAVGLPVGNIWGMSEAMMCTMNPPARLKLDTVGVFLDGVEGRVADDGELLVRGVNLFSGYLAADDEDGQLENPVDDEGWLHTGDLGDIDDDGYLRIVGRKKELMITATGANIAPAQVEGALRGASDLIEHALAVAEGRRYVTAVVALDDEALAHFATERGLAADGAPLREHPEIREEIARAVHSANGQLPKSSTVRGWVIAEAPWSAETGELTPTMKLRRGEVLRKYAASIEGLYG